MMFLCLSRSVMLLTLACSNAWIPPAYYNQRGGLASTTTTLSMAAPLPQNYQEIGDELIREAGVACGVTSLDVSWKSGIVTVIVKEGNLFLSSLPVGDEEEDEEGVELDEEVDDEVEDDEQELFSSEISAVTPSGAIDVVQLARAINFALDQNEIGGLIAETHAIEVTTPGAPEELVHLFDSPIWEAYKGYDVTTQFMDNKTKKIKTIEGRLQDRTDEFTTINIKGRMKKLKNEAVLSVKLPKAKKEKGSK